ncbi:Bug family tripartite tricarboxylate transporter substrate binding protein [Falsiroseomonas selenitidurans]|uniref:Tripartite tricarboxylate transporter substrate binding protein n=1 Tax=Falsiroseomonas selenitidurans TaxID=2716335 RepID=A0ABX1E096_9PROT|nr:tripartite tricarboxylate transporter substrate binding protein [Falsiroseomonas selenitidurans]NKC29258.1 tripartite tricarboxylate transporter substrate binding protein [Falsiroseomonas selenitidurans]
MLRRRLLLAAPGLLALRPALAQGQDWPRRPVRVIVPFAAGSSSDTVARQVMARAQEHLGGQVVIENRAGAGGLIASQAVARAEPDGYTLLWGGGTAITQAVMQRNPGYDWAQDFTPVTQIAEQPAVLCVRQAAPWRDAAALLAACRESREGLRYGSGGVGTPAHMAAAAMLKLIGAQGVHVPYRGANQAALAVEQGEVDWSFAISNIAVPRAQDGLIRVLITGGGGRMPVMPAVPTLGEVVQGGPVVTSISSLIGPKGLPPAVVARLHAAVKQAVEGDAALREALTRDGGAIILSPTPAAYAEKWPEEHQRLVRLVALSGVRVE